MRRKIAGCGFIALICLITGCAPAQYQKADLGFYGGRQGYLDREIEPGVFVLEYSHIGGYNYDLELNQRFWLKRAAELCPGGYDGGYNIVHPAYARLEEFKCPQRFCSDYPLVSGVIRCKKSI